MLTWWDPTMHNILWTHLYKRAWRWPVYRSKHVAHDLKQYISCVWRTSVLIYQYEYNNASDKYVGPEIYAVKRKSVWILVRFPLYVLFAWISCSEVLKALLCRLALPEVLKYCLVWPRDMESDVLWGEDKENFLKKINYRHLNIFSLF